MLDKAFAKIVNNINFIFQSDQGWQYQHKLYQQSSKKKEFVKVCPEKETSPRGVLFCGRDLR